MKNMRMEQAQAIAQSWLQHDQDAARAWINRQPSTRIIFEDMEISNWTWDAVAGAFYWHRFYSHQSNLNFDNQAVRQEMISALEFWLDLGVDGVRLDAVPYLYEREGTNWENLPETHHFLKAQCRHIDERCSDRMLLAEANQWPDDAVAYFGTRRGDECHMAVSLFAHASTVHGAAHGGPGARRGHNGADTAHSRNRAMGTVPP